MAGCPCTQQLGSFEMMSGVTDPYGSRQPSQEAMTFTRFPRPLRTSPLPELRQGSFERTPNFIGYPRDWVTNPLPLTGPQSRFLGQGGFTDPLGQRRQAFEAMKHFPAEGSRGGVTDPFGARRQHLEALRAMQNGEKKGVPWWVVALVPAVGALAVLGTVTALKLTK